MGMAISWTDFLSDVASRIAANEGHHSATTDEEFDRELAQWVRRAAGHENRAGAAAVIRACRHTRGDELNLGDGLQEGFGLKTLPDCIGDLTHITVLRLVGNQLTSLPHSIGCLPRLQAIYLFGNRLKTLPEAICNCAALERLYLAGNRIEFLPDAIGALQKLQVLSLPGNRLSALPESIGELVRLRDLYLFDNPLSGLPASFTRLRNLERLHLGSEYLKEQYANLSKNKRGPARH